MLPDNLLERINELARKKKSEGLTESELSEQQKLRKEYIQLFRNQVEEQLATIKVVDEEGTDVTPDKLKELKAKKNKNNN
jgi:uncharacterized protein YnzC (UPF0291/DUF896 family)